jgi:predicted aspartyl protease
MKTHSFLAASAAIGLAMAGNAAAAETPKCKLARIAEWPVRTEYYRPIVDGEINGKKIGILLDTGAQMSLVQRSATTKLGLTRSDATGYRASGIGGETHAEYVHIDEFRIGQTVRKNWRMPVAGEHDFSDDVAVLLGLGDDFFRQVDVEFDLAHNAVRLYETRDCEGVSLAYWTTEPAGVVPMEAGAEIWLTVAINGKPVRARLDSGASASVLAMPDAARLGVTPDTAGVIAGGCTTGLGRKRVDSWIAPFESFAIGNEIIKDPKLRFAPVWEHTTSTEIGSRLPSQLPGLPEMLLGADFLRAHRVLIAHSQRKMYFTYAGGTVFPSAPSKGCNNASPSDPRPDPLPKQRDR